jgi:hypothetical protein
MKALVIITHTDDPAASIEALQHDEAWRPILDGAEPNDFEGIYLEVSDERGPRRPVRRSASVEGGRRRVGAGGALGRPGPIACWRPSSRGGHA